MAHTQGRLAKKGDNTSEAKKWATGTEEGLGDCWTAAIVQTNITEGAGVGDGD